MFEADIAAAFRSANPYDGPRFGDVRGFFHAAKKLECVLTDARMLAMPKIMPLGPNLRNRGHSGHHRTSAESVRLTRSRHRAEAFQIEAQAGPGSGIPPAKMSRRVSLSDGEGLLPSLCSDEPRAKRMDQRVRQRSTHRVRDFVFARFAERPVFARPTETSCRIKQRATY